jgi:hypothetical protein
VHVTEFERELEGLINKHSKENDSNTPDFLIAQFLVRCLDAWNETSNAREKWYGKGLRIGGTIEEVSS